MDVTSPGILSDLIFLRFGGEVTNRGKFVKVQTPDNPDYYFGNLLILPGPPDDVAKVVALFDAEFADASGVQHHTFLWEPTARLSTAAKTAFTAKGFFYNHSSVLTAQSVHDDRHVPDGVSFRKLETDAEWDAALDAQMTLNLDNHPREAYIAFKTKQFVQYRDMADAGLGGWFGAFKGNKLVADMGLYFDDTIGRFQSVETHPDHRRQGIARALVQWVSNWGFLHRPGATLMIHADHGEVAETIYKSLGFRETEQLESLYRPPV